uniref:Alpha-2-macroglobulin like 1 n=1 Tax=Cebus imitator TaxID=2715852 RepID=A0A2K5PFI2_CEBIM
NYLVTLPAQLNFPSVQKVCLDLSPGYYDVKFTVTLETKDKTQKLLEHSGLNKRHLHCISFLVPPPADGTEEVATIRVSGVGNNISFEEKKKVLIQRQGSGTFVQTDKPIYTPGQQVHFRIVTLDSNFVPVNDKYSMVELQDPNSNRIAQWLEVVPQQGIVDLSFQLAPEAMLGTYTVAVAEGKTFGTFSVEEYVLPKFKAEVVEPKGLSTVQESFLVKICCRYTYGKPMLGAVQVSVCQKAHTYWYREVGREQLPDKCRNLSGQTDKTGCFSAPVDMATFNLTGYAYSHEINIVATVVEEGTGVEANATQNVYISPEMGSMTFEDTNNFYHPNFPFSGKISVRGHDDSLLKNHPVFLVIYGTNGVFNQTLVTDNDGLAPFTLGTSSWNGTDVSLELIGKGNLVMEGQKHLNPKKKGLKGSFSLSLTFTSRLAPDPSLVIYAIFPSGGVVADKIQFSVEMCFDNQVSVGFSPSQQLPGAEVELQLQAAPGSLCALRAVDESVLLLRPERELSNRSVYGMFPFWYGRYPYQVAEYDMCPASGPWDFPQPLIDPVPQGHLSAAVWRPWLSEGSDLFSIFQDVGLKILSNAKIKKPVDCSHPSPNYGPPMARNAGKEAVHVTVPDTITEWKAISFCTSQSRGFGLSPTIGLTAFKPFFVDLTLPYSVVRGESFRLTATIFNYLKDCIRVQTDLAKSHEYQLESRADSQTSSCLCADEAKTYHWNITAVKLGHINFTVSTKILDSNEPCGGQKGFVPQKGQSDMLIKPVLVKPEGVLVEKTRSSLLCPKGKVVSESVSLEVPAGVVPDSTKAYVTVLGDIMGTALQNLDGLVQMPSGCGEQNMVLFAPIIYVLQYLEKAGLLTEEIKSRAVGFLEIGYQKELTYKHSNGSYSAFGEQDGDGNTWLTAFVTKCFGQAQKFIFIDPKNIQDALKWMAGHQLPSGCYANVGKLLHTAMKGGVDDEVSLTAYVMAALLEMGKAVDDPMVSQGLQCLRNSVTSTSNLYTQAQLAYIFSLAGEMDMRSTLLKQLDQKAIISGESIHWSQKSTPSLNASPWSEPASLDVELTAYVLLAQLTKPNLTQKEIAKATNIVAWLAKQRNAYGGFSSTQDTVVALQALAKYATTAYMPSEDVSLAVKSTENFQRTFNIHSANRLVFQQETLPNVPGMYTLEASGQGCVYAQLSKNTQTYTFTISQNVFVTNLKPAAIKVYDYYLPDEQATIQYSDPCE